MTLLTIVTHAAMPDGVADDHQLAEAIEGAGGTVRFAVWNDPKVDWSMATVTVVRSAWDYHLSPSKWFAWLEHVTTMTRLVNDPSLIRWNSDKRYLLDLARSGISIVPSLLLETSHDLASTCADQEWRDIVIKPVIGASGHGTGRFHQNQLMNEAIAHATTLLIDGPVLVQPYQPAVERDRERSLVYIDGCFSHALTKPAFYAGLGNDDLATYSPTEAERILAEDVLARLAQPAVFARIDMLPGDNGPMLMEAELIEPQLALHLGDGSASKLAAALMQKAEEG